MTSNDGSGLDSGIGGTVNTHGPVGISSPFKVGAVGTSNMEHLKTFQQSHYGADTDASPIAIHHTLGKGKNQALPGSAYDELIAAFSALVVVGKCEIWMGRSNIPNSFMLLRGNNISRTTYAELFAVWGTDHGAGDGVTTFGTPDPRVRNLMGTDILANIGNNDGVSYGSRLIRHGHIHNHDFSVVGAIVSGTTISSQVPHDHVANTGSSGSHNHGGSVGSGGSHNHGGATGGFSHSQATNTTVTGSGNRLTGPTNHDHSIADGGLHAHTINTEPTHNHSVTVNTTSAATSHSHDYASPVNSYYDATDDGGTFNHPWMYVGIIVRYTSDLTAPGVA